MLGLPYSRHLIPQHIPRVALFRSYYSGGKESRRKGAWILPVVNSSLCGSPVHRGGPGRAGASVGEVRALWPTPKAVPFVTGRTCPRSTTAVVSFNDSQIKMTEFYVRTFLLK